MFVTSIKPPNIPTKYIPISGIHVEKLTKEGEGLQPVQNLGEALQNHLERTKCKVTKRTSQEPEQANK
jgi:hypothetical protein